MSDVQVTVHTMGMEECGEVAVHIETLHSTYVGTHRLVIMTKTD